MSIEDYRKKLQKYRELLVSESMNEGLQMTEGVDVDPETERERMLSELQNAAAPQENRMAALLGLKALSFSDSEVDSWLPRFRDSLRSIAADTDQGIREAAFEVLIAYGDTDAQERLINSLTSKSELIPDDQALRLLSQDPHISAREVALTFTSPDIDESTRLEAYRVLASDPDSADRFANLLTDPGEKFALRVLAATALNNIDRPRFRNISRELVGGLEEGIETSVDADLQKHIGSLLELPE